MDTHRTSVIFPLILSVAYPEPSILRMLQQITHAPVRCMQLRHSYWNFYRNEDAQVFLCFYIGKKPTELEAIDLFQCIVASKEERFERCEDGLSQYEEVA